jgi:hypothetical protein
MSDTPKSPGRVFDPTIGKRTQFQKGNAASLKSGAYAAMVRARDRQREAMLAKAGVVQALDEACTDLERELEHRQGFAATITQKGLVRRYHELDGVATVLFGQLMEGRGPVTATGAIRRIFAHYLKVAERQTKVAIALGLPKAVRGTLPRGPVLPSLAAYRAPDEDDA